MDWDAIFRGGGQGATLGFGDEIAARILAAAPQNDGTGIPREYAGGQYEQYRDEMRADNAAARERAPWQYGISQAVGAVPIAIATSPLAGGATGAARVAAQGLQGGALGGIQGAGESTNSDLRGLARDTAIGAGIGGGLGLAGGAAVEGLKSARDLALRGLVPAGGGGLPMPRAAQMNGVQITKAVPPRPGAGSASIYPEGGDITEIAAERMARGGGESVAPQAMDTPLPKAGRVPDYHGMPEEEAKILEQRLRQTEASFAKRHDREYGAGKAEADRIAATATDRPPRPKAR